MDKRVENTHKTLFKVIYKMIIQEGIKKPSVKEICDRANINKSTFYRNFSDLDNLLKSAIKKLAITVIEQIPSAGKLFENPYATLTEGKVVSDKFKKEFTFISNNSYYLSVFKETFEKVILSRLSNTKNPKSMAVIVFVINGVAETIARFGFTDKVMADLSQAILSIK